MASRYMNYKDWLKVKGARSTAANAAKWKGSSHGQYYQRVKARDAAAAAAATPAPPPKPPPVALPAIPQHGDATALQQNAQAAMQRDTSLRTAGQSYSDWLSSNVGAGAFTKDANGKFTFNTLNDDAIRTGKTGTRLTEQYTKQREGINSNAAARGMGRSGNRTQNLVKSQNDHTKDMTNLTDQYRQASSAYSGASNEAKNQYQTSVAANNAAGVQRETQRRHNTYGVGGWR